MMQLVQFLGCQLALLGSDRQIAIHQVADLAKLAAGDIIRLPELQRDMTPCELNDS